jgi:thiamine biosynthesis lipoprotein ApbE
VDREAVGIGEVIGARDQASGHDQVSACDPASRHDQVSARNPASRHDPVSARNPASRHDPVSARNPVRAHHSARAHDVVSARGAKSAVDTTSRQLARASWQALGTSVELVLTDHGALTQARAIVERELEGIDWTCSRFREDSELTRVNAQAGRTVRVDPLLIDAVEVALRAAELTGGDVDPTLGAALELAGYDRDWRLLDPPDDSTAGVSQAPRLLARVRAGWDAVELDRERSTLRTPRGVKLDLGATAKAWAADRATLAVHDATGCGVLVSLGGDISTAGPAPTCGWRIHVTDDHRSGPHAPGQTISIHSGGLATSSTAVRRWRHDGHTMNHIIDPSTQAPTISVWRTVSVAAIDCADANIAATAAIVRGEQAPQWLADLRVPARLVDHDGNVLTVGSWPQDGKLS